MPEPGDDPAAYPRFPITQGLCGAALDAGKPIIVSDVRKDPRYLPAFHTTRSEIIVPMSTTIGTFVGMLDAESDKLNAFGEEDRQFLERAARSDCPLSALVGAPGVALLRMFVEPRPRTRDNPAVLVRSTLGP